MQQQTDDILTQVSNINSSSPDFQKISPKDTMSSTSENFSILPDAPSSYLLKSIIAD